MTTATVALVLALAAEPAAAAPPAKTVASLAWMAGSWEGPDAEGVENEEVWLAPKGGAMLGVHRDVAHGKAVSFEFFRVSEEPAGVTYWASPKGRPAVPFVLAESGPRRVVFANPEHDFPKRILYWLDDRGALHARIEGDGGQAMEWTWRRAKP